MTLFKERNIDINLPDDVDLLNNAVYLELINGDFEKMVARHQNIDLLGVQNPINKFRKE